jgi:hypothetical protein
MVLPRLIKVNQTKMVMVSPICFFSPASFGLTFCLSFGFALPKTLQTRQAKAGASLKVFKAERKQTRAKFKRQSLELNKLRTKLCKVSQNPNPYPSFDLNASSYLNAKARIQTAVSQLRCYDRKIAPLTPEFDSFARSVLATGCLARQARDNMLLTLQYLLPLPTVSHNFTFTLTSTLFLILTQSIRQAGFIQNKCLESHGLLAKGRR